MKLQAPGKGQDEDYICSLLYVNGHVWCGTSDGTINIFNPKVRHLTIAIYGAFRLGNVLPSCWVIQVVSTVYLCRLNWYGVVQVIRQYEHGIHR